MESELDKLTQRILDSYAADERTQRIGQRALPSRARIVEVVAEMREALFPGYSGARELTAENVRYHLGDLVVRLKADLADQINHCLCTERRCDECTDPEKCRDEAAGLAGEFLSRVPKVRRMLAGDAQAAYDGDPAAKSIDEVIYCYPGFYAVTVYRLAHELLELGVPLMPRIMTEYAHSVTGADIHPGATIGENFFVDHSTGVVIGETTRIGDNVKLYQGVTLGALSFPKDERGRLIKGLQRHPTIEDNVTIYANATILGGNTTIGAAAVVGGNTFITESVAPGSTVASETPKLRVKNRKQ
ncbi:MAG: serine O-acetyltransferase [Planctomycetota bacterium]